MAQVTKREPGLYVGRLAGRRGELEVYVRPCNEGAEVRTSVYDGAFVHAQPRGGYDPDAAARAEFDRLQALADAGRPLWSE